MRINLKGLGFKELLFIVGISIIICALGFKAMNYREVEKSKNRITAKLDLNKDDSFKEDLVVSNEIGRLIIPSIDIEGVIVEGIEEEDIRYNIGHFPNSPMPDKEGNFALAGHRGTIYNNIFNNIHKINVGDEIIIEIVQGVYVYKVTEQFTVKPHETEILDNVPGERAITIVTCTVDGKERLIVKGDLVEENKNE